MKLRINKAGRLSGQTALVELCVLVDRWIPAARTAFLVAGLAAAAGGVGQAADFLFATGLIFHFAICFENWWLSTVRH